ncbi:MAG: ferritin-like domain-containing protein [Desulfobacca sp.]|uniref:ferritin-like domain-containing protein n=1 Tax=Desulfobacca sp. TaxID=2067990 RepID=UPI00404B84F4
MSETEGLIRIFAYALNQEETGKKFFQDSLARLNIGAAVSAFQRLIQEEEKHIAFLQRLIGHLKAGQQIAVADVEDVVLKPVDYFEARARSEFLERCTTESMIPDVTVFNLAWLIEKDLSEFYHAMSQKTSGEARLALAMLADWEASHEKFFRQFRDALTETYARMPWGG